MILWALFSCFNHQEGLNISPAEELYQAILIPSGEFVVGCTLEQEEHCGEDEKPALQGRLDYQFYIMESEVTQEFYQQVMGENPSIFRGKNLPVENVSWFDTVKFANALSKIEGLESCYQISEEEVSWIKGGNCKGWRLPTEIEFEYAARGGKDYKYAGSNNLDEVGWYNLDLEKGTTKPVCTKKTNDFGLCDMSGNVWEWCWDWHEHRAYWEPADRGTDTEAGKIDRGKARVLRGGGWHNYSELLRVSARGFDHPLEKGNRVGFRLVRTASNSSYRLEFSNESQY